MTNLPMLWNYWLSEITILKTINQNMMKSIGKCPQNYQDDMKNEILKGALRPESEKKVTIMHPRAACSRSSSGGSGENFPLNCNWWLHKTWLDNRPNSSRIGCHVKFASYSFEKQGQILINYYVSVARVLTGHSAVRIFTFKLSSFESWIHYDLDRND